MKPPPQTPMWSSLQFCPWFETRRLKTPSWLHLPPTMKIGDLSSFRPRMKEPSCWGRSPP